MTRPKFNYTVKELISVLEKFPGDFPVLTNGYENGFENVMEPVVFKMKQEADRPWYDGEFDMVEKDVDSFEAVVLRRVVRNE